VTDEFSAGYDVRMTHDVFTGFSNSSPHSTVTFIMHVHPASWTYCHHIFIAPKQTPHCDMRAISAC